MKSKILFFSMLVFAMSSMVRAEDSLIQIGGASEAPIEMRLNDGSFQTRYRYETDPSGKTIVNGIEYQLIFDATISFFQDHVRLDMEAQTGSAINSGWDKTGIPTGKSDLSFFIRRLALTLSPKAGLDFTIGSMRPDQGAGSENTSIDNDGYIMGYRVKTALEGGYVTVTTGYVGDTKNPNVFNRFNRLSEMNYIQTAITHSIGKIVMATLEYNQLAGENYLRGAMKFDVGMWATFLDSITIEDMANVTSNNLGDLLSVKLSKRFKDLAYGRDLATAVSYIYETDRGFQNFPIGDKVWNGQSIKVNVSVPNALNFGTAQLGTFVEHIQSITDISRFRTEVGMILKF